MKNFKRWIDLKPKIDTYTGEVEFKEREIWWSYLGTNIGDEEDGKSDLVERPVLILKKFSGRLFLAFPLSTKIKNSIFYFNIKDSEREYSVLLSQIRVLSSKRLIRRIENKISRGGFKRIKTAFKNLLNLDA